MKNIIFSILVFCFFVSNAWTQCNDAIGGSIVNDLGEPLIGAQIQLTHDGEVLSMATADNQGNYTLSLSNIDQDGLSIEVIQESNEVLNGVSTLDMVIIIKHILLVEEFDKDNLMAIADINCDGHVTMFDVVYLRRVILGIDNHFPNGDYCGMTNQDVDLHNLSIENCVLEGVENGLDLVAYPKGNVSGN